MSNGIKPTGHFLFHPVPATWFWNFALIYNDDRNSGNLLIDSNWDLILIDHPRAFRKLTDLPNQDKIRYCHKEVWDRLRTLNPTGSQRTTLALSDLRGN